MRSILSRSLMIAAVAAVFGLAACGDDDPATPCSADNCNGCCVDGECKPGNTLEACGLGGGACAACTTGQVCSATGVCEGGQPPDCSAGCLDDQQKCQLGNTNEACGTGGNTCIACKSGETCNGGKCEAACSFTTCPDGCCADDGTCVKPVTDAQCGAAGAACQACTGGKKCESGVCADPTKDCTDCPGCCSGGTTCLPGDTPAACGASGAACVTCKPGEKCENGACVQAPVACDKTTCPSGCCLPDETCVPFAAQGVNKCGTNGEACNVCTGGSPCQQGTCVGNLPCSSFCKQGCCTASGQCVEFPDQDAKQCGTGGVTCSACSGQLSCAQGGCITDAVWEVWVVSAVIAAKKKDGKDWDTALFANPLPDPYVGAKLSTSLLIIDFTKTIDNTITPQWNEKLTNWSQSDLLNKGLEVAVRDSDGINGIPYETIDSCTVSLTQADLTAGTKTINCGTLVTQLVLQFKLKN